MKIFLLKNLTYKAIAPAEKLVMVMDIERARDINHAKRDSTLEARRKKGSKIVEEPRAKDSGTDHQNIKAEVDKKNRPKTKELNLERPRLTDIK